MDRKFGIELEIVGITRQTALRALSAVGIHVQDESYNHTTRGYWKLVPDGSVRGGFEVVSPILEGERGIEEAMTVAEALSDAFMPPSRRGNANTYCESVTGFLNRRFNEARTMDELAAAQPGRYFKVNLQS